MKYGEDKICKEIENYIKSTYSEHYSTTKDGFQVQDMLRHLGIDKDFCQANAIKYLARYGKKNGKNRKDLLKAILISLLNVLDEREKVIVEDYFGLTGTQRTLEDIGGDFNLTKERVRQIKEKALRKLRNDCSVLFDYM